VSDREPDYWYLEGRMTADPAPASGFDWTLDKCVLAARSIVRSSQYGALTLREWM
jgi:hypothetical protein